MNTVSKEKEFGNGEQGSGQCLLLSLEGWEGTAVGGDRTPMDKVVSKLKFCEQGRVRETFLSLVSHPHMVYFFLLRTVNMFNIFRCESVFSSYVCLRAVVGFKRNM